MNNNKSINIVIFIFAFKYSRKKVMIRTILVFNILFSEHTKFIIFQNLANSNCELKILEISEIYNVAKVLDEYPVRSCLLETKSRVAESTDYVC